MFYKIRHLKIFLVYYRWYKSNTSHKNMHKIEGTNKRIWKELEKLEEMEGYKNVW